MSTNKLELQGFAELRDALRKLPAELTKEASHIVEGAANGAAADIKAAYARGKTGNLIDGVYVRHSETATFAAGAIVVSKAPHAWMYENGTQVRHTASGANRGVMPPAPPGRAFIPIVIRHRRQMQGNLVGLLERNGLVVTGTP